MIKSLLIVIKFKKIRRYNVSFKKKIKRYNISLRFKNKMHK